MADPFIGEIRLFGFNFNPRGWSLCAGALLPISTNSTMFSLLGTQYGGDGRTTFALPDLRGRTPVAKGRHPGSVYDWRMGQQGGEEYHTLTVLEMPTHAHGASFSTTSTSMTVELSATAENGDSATPSTGAYLAAAHPPGGGPDKPEQIYASNPSRSTLHALGGVTVSNVNIGGSITVQNNGAGQAFNIIQPLLVANYSIAMQGIYPPRS